MYKVGEVAALFAVTEATVREWLRDDLLEGVKIGQGYYWRVPEDAVIKFANKRHGDAKNEA